MTSRQTAKRSRSSFHGSSSSGASTFCMAKTWPETLLAFALRMECPFPANSDSLSAILGRVTQRLLARAKRRLRCAFSKCWRYLYTTSDVAAHPKQSYPATNFSLLRTTARIREEVSQSKAGLDVLP